MFWWLFILVAQVEPAVEEPTLQEVTFFNQVTPGLATLVATHPPQGERGLGVAANFSFYSIYPYNQTNFMPTVQALIGPFSYKTLGFWAKGGIYPEFSLTGNLMPFLGAGMEFTPERLKFLRLILNYSHAFRIEYLPGDPQFNFVYNRADIVQCLLNFLNSPYIRTGVSVASVDGLFRQDILKKVTPFSRILLSEVLGLGVRFRIFRIKTNLELMLSGESFGLSVTLLR